MGSGFSVDTGATDKVAAAFTDAAAQLADPAPVLADVASQVARYAAPRTPRRTGALANSFTTDRATVDGHPAVALTWGVRYAPYVNFGTRTQRAQPFATDALTAAAADADRTLTDWATHLLDL